MATDEELFARGDPESLTALVARYERPLYGLLHQMTAGDANLADDLFQETFLRAVRAAGSFDRTRNFRVWLTAIAVNVVRDEARRRKSRSEVALDGVPDDEQETVEGEGPRDVAEQNDEARRVWRALAGLTQKEREVVVLHFYQRLTLTEIAAAARLPVGTVKSRLHGALLRLRSLLR